MAYWQRRAGLAQPWARRFADVTADLAGLAKHWPVDALVAA